MKLRHNTMTLNHSTSSHPGTILNCKLSLSGTFLGINDTEGDLCLYSLKNLQEITCIGEVRIYKIQFNPMILENSPKNEDKILSLEYFNQVGEKFSLITKHNNSIKIWKLNSSDIFNPTSQFQSLSQQQDGVRRGKEKMKFCGFQPELKQQIETACQALKVSQNQKQLLLRTKQTVTLWNVEKGVSVYEQKPANNLGLPVTKRLSNQTRTDYQERIEAELNYWNSLDFVTNSGFQRGDENIVSYSNKLGCINLFDIRNADKDVPVNKVENRNRKSVVESSLNIPSDYTILENGYEVISRDFLYVYKWDLRNNKGYIDRISVYPSINAQICQLYQEGDIYNRFSLATNSSGSAVITNHFQNSFHEINFGDKVNYRYRWAKEKMRVENVTCLHPIPKLCETKVLGAWDYCEKRDLVVVGEENRVRLLESGA